MIYLAIIVVALLASAAIYFWTRQYYLHRYADLKNWKEIKKLESESKAAKEFQLQEKAKEIQNAVETIHKLNLEADEARKNLQDREAEYNQYIGSLQEKAQQEYEHFKQEQEKELALAAKEFSETFIADSSKKVSAAKELDAYVEKLKSTVSSAIEISKHKLEEEQKKDFFRLQLTQEEVDDVKHLREIESELHNCEPLNKVIWKVYYEKPYTDLIGRVVGLNKVLCGIYKITNIETQQTYVGQAVNIAERWRQHIKRGVGAESPTQNKLYPAMKRIGPENFTFEVIETCDRKDLDAREDYWQDFYKAKEFGYSIK